MKPVAMGEYTSLSHQFLMKFLILLDNGLLLHGQCWYKILTLEQHQITHYLADEKEPNSFFLYFFLKKKAEGGIKWY